MEQRKKALCSGGFQSTGVQLSTKADRCTEVKHWYFCHHYTRPMLCAVLLILIKMREIKFRGKTANGWVIGKPFKSNNKHHTPDLWFLISDKYDINGYGGNSWINVSPKTLGQFIGVKDINGIEIYEGDIVRPSSNYIDCLCVVVYQDYGFALKSNRWVNHFAKKVWDTVEVVGNIHDNPELLNVAQHSI